MVDEGFARPVVIDDFLIEIFLLALDLALNAGGVEIVAVAVRVGGLANGFVVDFRSTVQRGEQVVSDGSDVELVKMPADSRREVSSQPIASD